MTTDQSAEKNPLVRLGELGQSPWYDYITRDLITSGELSRLIGRPTTTFGVRRSISARSRRYRCWKSQLRSSG